MGSKFSVDFGARGLERKFTGFTGQRVSVELRFLKASFPEEFGCEKKVPLGGLV